MPAAKEHGRPKIHSPREILDAIFYVLRSGCQWRLLPHDFPRWPTVYHYFRAWRIYGTWERINRSIRERLTCQSQLCLNEEASQRSSHHFWVVLHRDVACPGHRYEACLRKLLSKAASIPAVPI